MERKKRKNLFYNFMYLLFNIIIKVDHLRGSMSKLETLDKENIKNFSFKYTISERKILKKE